MSAITTKNIDEKSNVMTFAVRPSPAALFLAYPLRCAHGLCPPPRWSSCSTVMSAGSILPTANAKSGKVMLVLFLFPLPLVADGPDSDSVFVCSPSLRYAAPCTLVR